MVEALIAWLAGLPPIAVYASIAVLATVENIFPPIPADTAIALGAFLAHRGVTTPTLVFGVTLVANMIGAMTMYFLAARHAPALYRSRLARRFLPEDGMAFVRREYQRFGLVGLFIGRLLPGFRAVVAPFAGLIHLGPLRAGIPMLLASALWYGGLIFGAALLGERFDDLLGIIGGLNRSLGYLALAAAIGLTFWGAHRWRAHRRGRA